MGIWMYEGVLINPFLTVHTTHKLAYIIQSIILQILLKVKIYL